MYRNLCQMALRSEFRAKIEPLSGPKQSIELPSVQVRLIRVDEAGDVMRDKNGLCVLCLPGEPGEFVGKIVKNHPSRGFDGYVDKRATERKIVKNVLKKGDMWFRSGDLLSMDEFGWMYFVDRLGDTFRCECCLYSTGLAVWSFADIILLVLPAA